MNHLKYYLILGLSGLLFSCSNSSLDKALELSGSNKEELLKVIEHYKDDPEKLKAVYFLIKNMEGKYSLVGEEVENFDVVFDILDSMHTNSIKIPVRSPIFQTKWDSLVNMFGRPMEFSAEKQLDLEEIKADYLINNIDAAFVEWRNNNLIKKLSFDQFCEYILPYRTKTERLENWREDIFKQFKTFRDTVKANNRFEFAEKLNGQLKDMIYLNHTLRDYPYAMKASQMRRGKRGACTHLVAYTAAVMRANGMPVGIDHAPRWGDLDKGHEWNVLLKEDGNFFPFDAGAPVFGGPDKTPYRLSKVFREVFAETKSINTDNTDIPKQLLRNNEIDVTHEYTKTYDLAIPLLAPEKIKNQYAIISTFGRKTWEPQDFGEISNGTAYFKNMGANLIYITMYYNKGRYLAATLPFILTKEGKQKFLKANYSKKIAMKLERKYPYLDMNTTRAKELLGAKIQGANRLDFRDSVTLYTITAKPLKFEEAIVNALVKFKYVRYLSAKNHRANIAELEFIGEGGEKLKGEIIGFPQVSNEIGSVYQHAFDNDLKTYFSADTVETSWVGLALSKPQKINKVRYCPRSDTNFIIVGNLYELKYWDGSKWTSLGKQIATEQYLIYNNVPSNTVYLLRNLTEGNEERIFTYENGKQIWW